MFVCRGRGDEGGGGKVEVGWTRRGPEKQHEEKRVGPGGSGGVEGEEGWGLGKERMYVCVHSICNKGFSLAVVGGGGDNCTCVCVYVRVCN